MPWINRTTACLAALALLSGCGDGGRLFDTPDAKKAGIDFENTLTNTEDANILDYLYFYNGGGVAMGDINNDGLPDLFFSGNQVKNKLYLNKGNLNFEDITESAGVAGKSDWNTGSVMADVNGDGLLDIYVCAVVGLNGFNGHNELYINQGNNTFKESAAQYGLDFDSFSGTAAFFDYDGDGDLDAYLLNHAIHTPESFGKADLRNKRNYQTGDKLLRNDGGHFTDVSEQAGIYGGVTGYGLGVAISDFNQDGRPDIFVGNDFHEDDYYYLNNGDGTFTEGLRDHFGHTSRSSMGNDVADINHDGLPDLVSLDMLPEDEKILKSTEGDDKRDIQKMRVEQFGYYYQFTRNMLFVNRPDGNFSEVALMAGMAATDWSWSSLFGDFDQDGETDLFITNGIPKRPNDLDFIQFISSDQIRNKINNTKLVDDQALAMMPNGAVPNHVFQGNGDLTFTDRSNQWIPNGPSVSGATAMGDLDNDGDLDLVVNNINAAPTLYINKTNAKSHYLKLQLQYQKGNAKATGAKALLYQKGKLQYAELHPSRGFQASSEPLFHFGLGQDPNVDSLRIIWPNGSSQVLLNVKGDQTLKVSPKGTKPFDYAFFHPKTAPLFTKIQHNLGITFSHKEDAYTHFDRERLIPYQLSDHGPAMAVGDLDGDGREDLFFGGSKYISSQVFLQRDTIFERHSYPAIAKDSIKEDVGAAIVDFNGDGRNDLFLASGGADFYNQMPPLKDGYYQQQDSSFVAQPLASNFENASMVLPLDFDGDGDMDLLVANEETTNHFGESPKSILYQNDQGQLKPVQQDVFDALGMLTDAVWTDFDADGTKDLIVVGEWMAPRFLKNTNGTFVEVKPLEGNLSGLWQSIIPFDIDGDGDMDYLLGNWGTNTKFRASSKAPMKLFYGDLDGNGTNEALAAIAKNGAYYPFDGLDELTAQMPDMAKKFPSHTAFAGKDINAIFDPKLLEKCSVKTVTELRSGYLQNEKGHFNFVPFGTMLQTAPIKAFVAYDFDNDGKQEVLAAGNYFGVKPFQGRYDAFPGALIKNDTTVKMGDVLGLDLGHFSVRHLNILTLGGSPYLLVTVNNGPVQVYGLPKAKGTP